MKRFLFIALLALVMSTIAGAAPRTPRSGNEVVALLPQRDDGLRALRSAVAAAPADPAPAVRLAWRYVELGRAAADPRYYGQAQAVLAPWWHAARAPSAVRLLRATLLQHDHRFAQAQAELRSLVVADPRSAQAWVTLAAVQTVQGDSAGAVASCARLSVLASQLDAIACLAAAEADTRGMRSGETLLRMALAREGDVVPALALWARTLLGELAARRGDAAMAERDFRTALQLAPHDPYLLGAYADFLLDQDRAADVPRLLRGSERIDALLLRQALALRARGDGAALAPVRAELQARFAAAALRGDAAHLREQARFTLHVLGEPRAALALALRNWAGQKELADTRLVLEAGLAAGDRPAVQPVLRWIRERGLEDAAVARLVGRLS